MRCFLQNTGSEVFILENQTAVNMMFNLDSVSKATEILLPKNFKILYFSEHEK